jgi:hypothetical protein
VLDKHLGNFCEYFDFARRVWNSKAENNSRESAARERLNRLLGD